MLFIAMIFLAFLFFAISNRVGVYPEMLFITMLFLSFLVAIFNKSIKIIGFLKQYSVIAQAIKDVLPS